MPVYRFAITVPATMTAQVEIEADSIEEAQEMALRPSFYQDPGKAKFELDEGNAVQDAYLPDSDDFTEVPRPRR